MSAREACEQVRRLLAAGDPAAVDVAAADDDPGEPFAVKEMIAVAGLVGGYGVEGSERRAAADAAAVAALRRSGWVPVATTRTSAAAYLADTDGVRNPLGDGLSPGGSSGGSAALVAAGVVTMALGTDTNGSARLPASACGIAGLRPTPDAVPRDGVLPCAPSLDTVGVLARDVPTVRRALAGIVDPGASPHHAELAAALARPADPERGLRLGRLPTGDARWADAAERTAVDAAARLLVAAGVEVVDLAADPVLTDGLEAVADLICLAEADVLAPLLELPGLPEAVRRDLVPEARPSGEAAARALAARAAVARACAALFAEAGVDALLLPGYARRPTRPPAPGPAPSCPYALATLAGCPALVVPREPGRAPGGVQLVGPAWSEPTLLDAGLRVQAALA